jgi:hypothetical protein
VFNESPYSCTAWWCGRSTARTIEKGRQYRIIGLTICNENIWDLIIVEIEILRDNNVGGGTPRQERGQ